MLLFKLLVLLIIAENAVSQCLDKDPFCNFWASENECSRDSEFMSGYCPVSCGICAAEGIPGAPILTGPFEPVDTSPHCCYWALKGQCDSNPYWMRPNCQYSCGTLYCTVANATACSVRLKVDQCPWKNYQAPNIADADLNSPQPEQPLICGQETPESLLDFYSLHREEIEKTWKDIAALSGGPTTENGRLEIAKEKLKLINAHNRNPGSYCMGITRFSFLTDNEAELILGYRSPSLQGSSVASPRISVVKNRPHKTIPSFKAAIKEKYSFDEEAMVLPLFVDWSGYTGTVQDQQSCRNSWAFVAAQNLAAIELIEHNRLVSYSVQQLTNCALATPSGERRNGCIAEGTPLDGWNFWEQFQALTEQQLPYTNGRGSNCNREQLEPASSRNILAAIHSRTSTTGAMLQKGEEKLRNVVAKHPVSAGLQLTTDFLRYYSHGIYENPDTECGKRINHAILIVGYGVENGIPYWKAKNSWGRNWGENGYFRIRQGRNVCGLAADISFPVLNNNTATPAPETPNGIPPSSGPIGTAQYRTTPTTMMMYPTRNGKPTTTMMTGRPTTTTMMMYETTRGVTDYPIFDTSEATTTEDYYSNPFNAFG